MAAAPAGSDHDKDTRTARGLCALRPASDYCGSSTDPTRRIPLISGPTGRTIITAPTSQLDHLLPQLRFAAGEKLLGLSVAGLEGGTARLQPLHSASGRSIEQGLTGAQPRDGVKGEAWRTRSPSGWHGLRLPRDGGMEQGGQSACSARQARRPLGS